MTTSEHKMTAAAFGTALELLDSGNLDDALAAFARALELDPGQAQIYARRAGAWHRKGDTALALADCDAAIGLDPGNASYHHLRGNLRNGQGDLDGAVADFDAALGLDPGLAAAHVAEPRLGPGAGRRSRRGAAGVFARAGA
jgi:tetratricopeptide (TPR) repeat protein